jgi:trk/ktr system potassium uptake protein
VAPDDRALAVSFAVRPRVVARYGGELAVALGALTLAPAAVALATGDRTTALAFVAAALALLGAGMPLRRMRAPEVIQSNEAMVIAASLFVVAPLATAWPLGLAGGLDAGDSLFEAISAVTTTGLTAASSVEGRSTAFLFTRAWMQWYGGLGVATLAVALLGGVGPAARRLGLAGADGEAAPGSLRLHARRMLVVYAALTVAGAGLLLALGAAPADAVDHALAALSTGGFSTRDRSLAGLPGLPVRAAAVALGFLGAVSLPLYDRVRREGLGALARNVELRALALACLVASGALAVLLVRESHLEPGAALRAAPLLAISAQTTTGFTPIDLAEVGAAAKWVMIASMLAGGSLGSTAGGVKLFRVLVAARLLQWSVRRARLSAHAIWEPRLGDERLGDDEIRRVVVVILCFVAVVGISWLPFLVRGYEPMDALFEVVSATATVGLSTGITRPALEDGLKAILCADMLLGRVEIVALLVALSPGTWRGRRAS